MHLRTTHSRVQGDATDPHLREDGAVVGTGLALPAAITRLNTLPTLATRGLFEKQFFPPFHILYLHCEPSAFHILAAQGFFFTPTAPCMP